MPQPQDIEAKIRAAAVAKNVDPDLALRIAQAESSGQSGAQNPRSTAQGLFQVIDDTWKRYGGKPGKKFDVDENIRVGTDILADNTNKLRQMLGRDPQGHEVYTAHFFGPGTAKHVLTSDASRPLNEILSKKVMEANPNLKGKTTGEFLQEMQGKVGAKAPTRAAAPESGPTASEKMMTDALKSGMSAQNLLQDAGPGYKAAMAMMFLADDKPKSEEDDIWKEAEPEQTAENDTEEPASPLASLDLSYQSPFPGQKPAPVAYLADGGMPFTPTIGVKGSARAELDKIKSDYDTYNTEVGKYNDLQNAYKSQVDAYNAAANAYNDSFLRNNGQMVVANVQSAGKMRLPKYTYYTANDKGELTAYTPAAELLKNATYQDIAESPGYSLVRSSNVAAPGAAPTAPTMAAPTAPAVTQEQYQAKAEAAKKDASLRQMAVNAAFDPAAYGLSMNKLFNEGGEAKSSAEDLAGLMPNIEDTSPAPFYTIKGANKQMIGNRELENMMMGLGTDSTTLGVNLSKMKQDDKENLAQSLMAAYRKQMGDVNLNVNMIRPVDAPPGVYMGALNAGIPVGNRDQLLVGASGMRTPDESRITGYNLGYSGEVGPGRLNAMMMQPKGNPQGRNYQIQYQIPLKANGGVVHRADGSPMGGENVDHLTPQEIERMAAAQQAAFVTPSSGRGRAAGNISQALASGEAYPAMARGVAETPYNLVGAPVDLATLAMRPFGYKDEKPVMGSEWIKEKMTKLGIRPGEEANPTLQGFRTLGELGASVVNPGPVAAKVGQVAEKGVAMAGKEMARQALRGMEGEGFLAPVSPPIMYAVKPRGGTFATSGSIDKPELSKFDELLTKYVDRATQEVPTEHQAAVREFIDKKARKYFTTEYGTGDDAVRNAIRTGNLPIAGRDVDRFPPYLLEAARNPEAVGHDVAKRHLEKFYDDQTNLDAMVLGLYNPSDADARRLFNTHMSDLKEQQRQLMSAEGVPNEYQNFSVSSYALPELEQYPSSTRILRNLVEAGESGTLPSGVQGALQRQQPIYDISQPYMDLFSPKQVAENIAAVPANKLKNMSFADAMIEGGKKMQVYRDYDAAIARADKGGTIPKAVLDTFTKPFLKGSTGEWKQITDARATQLEGKLMNHSVGGYADGNTYGTTYTGLPVGGKKAFDEGLVKVYSLRDDKGMPTVTLEMAKSDGGQGNKWNITQIRGPFNSEPAADQWDDIFKFIEKGDAHLGELKQNSYSKNRAGETIPGSVVNWGRAYRDWKDGIDPMQGVQRSANPPGWGNAELAQGGAVERVSGDNRRYL